MGFLSVVYSIIVVIVIFFLAWFVTRFVASRSSFTGQPKTISILEKSTIAKDSYIILVKFDDKLLLLGTTPQGINLLKEIDADKIDLNQFETKKESFAEILKNTINNSLPDGKIKNSFQSFQNFVDKKFSDKKINGIYNDKIDDIEDNDDVNYDNDFTEKSEEKEDEKK